MHIYGITGGIASGKSTVTSYLQELGCPVIDADVISRQVVAPNKPSWRALIGVFGVEILNDDGTINRSKLGSIIFDDTDKRRLLNSITHPYIQSEIVWQIVKCFLKGEPFVVLVSPLLYESGKFLRFMKKIIVINCSSEQQLARLTSRDNLTEEEAQKRISSQMSLKKKCQMADYVIDNTGERDYTEQQTYHLFYDMKQTSRACGLHKWLLVLSIFLILLVIKIFI